MIFTQFIRHAGESLRSFLARLGSDLDELQEHQRLNYISRAKIGFNNGALSLLDSYNIHLFIRLASGHYYFVFARPYKNNHYSLVFEASSHDLLVVKSSAVFFEVKSLRDIEFSLICQGEISDEHSH